MFKNIYNYFFKKNVILNEEEWINQKLNEWKVQIFTENKYLQYIPNERILEKRRILKKQYEKLYC